MRCINYKCNSCGGKIMYNQEHNDWKCEYCGLEYNTLYKNDKLIIEHSSQKINVHEYKCTNCQAVYVKNDNIEFSCPKCGKNVKKIKKISSNFFFNPTAQKESAFFEYGLQNNKISYKNDNNAIKYIRFEFYKGEVIIRYHQNNKLIKRTYVFSNFPNTTDETLSYIIKKKLSYLNYIKIKNSNNNQLTSVVEIANEIDNKKIDVSENILNECIKNIIEEKNIKENDIISVENNLSIIDDIYIPFYQSELNIENSSCLNYQIGISNPQQIVETATEKYTILDNKPKIKKYRYIAKKIGTVFVLLFILMYVKVHIIHNYTKESVNILIASTIIFLILYIIGEIYFIKKGGITIKKDEIYSSKCIISKNELVTIDEEILK